MGEIKPFYKDDPIMELEYRFRSGVYREIMEDAYPEIFSMKAHMVQIQEMVRKELLLEFIDDQIGENFLEAGALIPAMLKVTDAVFRYRRELGLTPKMMASLMDTTPKSEGWDSLAD